MESTVSLQWKGAMQFESEGPGGKVLIAAGSDTIETREGLRPKAMMLSSLAGCAGMDVAFLIPKMRVEVDGFDIDVVGRLTETSPQTYDHVLIKFSFYGSDLPEKKLLKIVDRSVNGMCGVLEMFKKFATIEVETVFASQKA